MLSFHIIYFEKDNLGFVLPVPSMFSLQASIRIEKVNDNLRTTIIKNICLRSVLTRLLGNTTFVCLIKCQVIQRS